MSHSVNWFLFAAVLIYTIVAIMISIISFIEYKKGVHALDYIIAYFSLLSITGIIQLLTPFLHNKSTILGLYEGVNSPLGYNPVRNLGMVAIIVLFVFSEHMLGDEINKYRLSIISSAVSIYVVVMLNYIFTSKLILVNDIIPFAQETRLDEMAYDVVLYSSVILVTYAFYKQYKNSQDSEYYNSIRIIFIGLTIFSIAYLYEWMEHFLPIIDIDFVYFSIPLFIGLGYVYTKTPHFAYHTPHDIHFLQITMKDGRLLYGTEIKNAPSSKSFLLSFSITNINILLTETLMANQGDIVMEKIKLNHGEIIFETIDDIILSVYTDRSSHILKRSMKYFIREFIKDNVETLEMYRQGIFADVLGDPDKLLRKCIPILSSRSFKVQEDQQATK